MDFLLYNNENLLTNFPPILQRHFEELLLSGRIGLAPITLQDISCLKKYTENNLSYGYCYAVKIPFAGKKLPWEVIFDPDDMTFAPDFNFNDDSFTMSEDLDLVVENIPSLVNWNIYNPKSLTSVLTEFLNLFKKQQLDKMGKENIYAQLSREYMLLTEIISPFDVEVYVENMTAHFLIKHKVDVSSLPNYTQQMKNGQDVPLNPGEDNCILKISYMKLDGSKISTSLQLSPKLEQALGGHKTLHIPNFSKQTLVEYVMSVIKLIQEQIERVEQNYKMKKEFFNCLCAMYGPSLLSFDSESFSSGEILCEVDDYYCRVCIQLGPLFPKDKPLITLHSLYCMSHKKPCMEILDDYPYSPRWSPELMLRKVVDELIEAIPKFKDHKH